MDQKNFLMPVSHYGTASLLGGFLHEMMIWQVALRKTKRERLNNFLLEKGLTAVALCQTLRLICMSLLMTEIYFSYNALSPLTEGSADCSTLSLRPVSATSLLLLAAQLGYQIVDPDAKQEFLTNKYLNKQKLLL